MALTPLQEKECQALKALFNEKSKISQREFVKLYDLGTPANLSQYLNGRRPLNITIASKVAAGLSIKVSDFSPRLASDIEELNTINNVSRTLVAQKKNPMISLTFAERLKSLMEEKKISNADLARIMGVTRATVKLWVDGKTLQLKYNDAVSLSEVFGVHVDWLMSGNGDKQIEDQDDSVLLKRINLTALCGKYPSINVPADDENNEERVEAIRAGSKWFFNNFPHYQPEDVRFVTATDDTMEPLIRKGDLVFVNIKENNFNRDGLYFVYLEGQYFIKRIQRAIGRKLILISENTSYRDIEITANTKVELYIIGRVVKSFKSIEY